MKIKLQQGIHTNDNDEWNKFCYKKQKANMIFSELVFVYC